MLPWRKVSSEQAEEAAACEVDVAQRVPRVLAELRLLELGRVDLLLRDASIDALVGGQFRLRQRLQPRTVVAEHGQAGAATGLGRVGPAVVVGVEADPSGPHGGGLEQVVQQPIEGVVERRPWLGTVVFGEGRELQRRVAQGARLLCGFGPSEHPIREAEM